MLAAAASRPPHQRLALRLLLEHRLTAHEICRLTTADVDGEELLVTDKRGQVRRITLTAADRAAVRADGTPGQLLAPPGGALRPETLRRLAESAARKAGVEPASVGKTGPHGRALAGRP